jgi:ribonuclease III
VPKNSPLDSLIKKLGYHFRDPTSLEIALTHRSFGSKHNERLEFLGDSILNFVIAEQLFTQFPLAAEGELSRLRASLVKGETLAEIAREMSLGDYLNLGEGELKSGGFRRASILADALEAIIGAIYRDSDIQHAKDCILRWFTSRLDGLSLSNTEKDAKSQLQEWLQGKKLPLPEYQVTQIDGESHNQQFTVSCKVSIIPQTTVAIGTNRKIAEKYAAQQMIEILLKHYGKP